MTSNLTTLTIEGLRGVSQSLELPFEKKMMLIYGENATGKTSICDALDFLGNGCVGSVVGIGLGTGIHKYWPFLGKNQTDITVKLESQTGDSWLAKSTAGTVNVAPIEGKPIVKIWRRNQLYKLILDKPADRYEVIRPFIDITEIELSEKKLKKCRDDINSSLNEATIKLGENQTTIRDLMVSMGGSQEDVIAWAKVELEENVETLDTDIDFLTRIDLLLNHLIEYLQQRKRTLLSLSEKEILEQNEEENYGRVVSGLTAEAEETLGILNAAKGFFDRHGSPKACPLCESNENVEGLPQKVNEAIESYKALQFAKTNMETATRTKVAEEQRLITTNQQIGDEIRQLKEHIIDRDQWIGLDELLESINLEDDLGEELVESLSQIRLTSLDEKSNLETSKSNRAALKSALLQYETNFESQAENQQLLPVVERIFEIHEQERKAFIDGILNSIANEVGRLYEEIHPNEGLNKISLSLRSAGMSSLNIESEFLDTQVPPGAYFSNSHIDSLGLCILIALAKLEQPENTILVMDDILGSIDEPHFDRMVQLIYAESSHFLQTVVTTHYHAWHHKIRRGQLRNADCGLIELRRWDEQQGVSIQTSARPLVEVLRESLLNRPGEIEPIASNAGHLLEQIGDFITLRYECSVPRRAGGNTLNDYLGALKPRLTKHIYVELVSDDGGVIDTIQVEPVIEELKEIYLVRNSTGAHYSVLASHLPPQDVLRFGELVLKLCDAFICTENGFPTKLRNGTYWSPPFKETRRQFPAAKP